MASEAQVREYERLRDDLRAEYDRLIAARRWLHTDPQVQQASRDASGPAASLFVRIYALVDESIASAVDAYERLAPVEWSFPAIAEHDAELYRRAARAATASKNKIELMRRDRLYDDGLAEADRHADRGSPPPGSIAGHPWRGRGGAAYDRSLDEQAQAGGYLASVADAMATFLGETGKSFGGVVQAFRDVLKQINMFAGLVISGLVSLASAVLTGGAGVILGLMALLGAAVHYLYWVSAAIEHHEKVRAEFASAVTKAMENLSLKVGDDVPLLFRNRGRHEWPDHTTMEWFPRVVLHSTAGSYVLATDLPELRKARQRDAAGDQSTRDR